MQIEYDKLDDELLSIKDLDGKGFSVYYAGSNLYFLNCYYENNNHFVVDIEDGILFEYFNTMFSIAENNQNGKNGIIENNKFIWYSESTGLLCEAHSLEITKNSDSYIIRFIYNEKHKFGNYSMCHICFCLDSSNNQIIADEFSQLYTELIESLKEKNNVLQLKKAVS